MAEVNKRSLNRRANGLELPSTGQLPKHVRTWMGRVLDDFIRPSNVTLLIQCLDWSKFTANEGSYQEEEGGGPFGMLHTAACGPGPAAKYKPTAMDRSIKLI